jgi:hypothetical protein
MLVDALDVARIVRELDLALGEVMRDDGRLVVLLNGVVVRGRGIVRR